MPSYLHNLCFCIAIATQQHHPSRQLDTLQTADSGDTTRLYTPHTTSSFFYYFFFVEVWSSSLASALFFPFCSSSFEHRIGFLLDSAVVIILLLWLLEATMLSSLSRETLNRKLLLNKLVLAQTFFSVISVENIEDCHKLMKDCWRKLMKAYLLHWIWRNENLGELAWQNIDK